MGRCRSSTWQEPGWLPERVAAGRSSTPPTPPVGRRRRGRRRGHRCGDRGGAARLRRRPLAAPAARRAGRPAAPGRRAAPAGPRRDRDTESRDTGKTLEESRVDVDDVTNAFRYFADLAMNESAGRVVDAARPDVHSIVVHEPVGVCALITPWNYPLLQATWKIAPALAAGNTFVLKPSEVTPLSTVHLMRLLAEAGLPAGVANLVTGAGDPVAPALRAPGRRPGLLHRRPRQRQAAEAARRHREEGRPRARRQEPQRRLRRRLHRDDRRRPGPQPRSSSQRPGLLRRRPPDHPGQHQRRFVTELARRADAIRLGRAPFDDGVECGPLVSAQPARQGRGVRRRRPRGGRDRCACGGGASPTTPARRRLLLPADRPRRLPPGDEVVREESFGPVLTVETLPHRGRSHHAGQRHRLRSRRRRLDHRRARADRVAGRLRHGTVWINDYHPYLPQAEWGGFGSPVPGASSARRGSPSTASPSTSTRTSTRAPALVRGLTPAGPVVKRRLPSGA